MPLQFQMHGLECLGRMQVWHGWRVGGAACVPCHPTLKPELAMMDSICKCSTLMVSSCHGACMLL